MATTQMTKTRRNTAKTKNAVMMATPETEHTATPMHDLIARRAYELWQASGCPEGLHEEHWYRAEQEFAPATKAAKRN